LPTLTVLFAKTFGKRKKKLPSNFQMMAVKY